MPRNHCRTGEDNTGCTTAAVLSVQKEEQVFPKKWVALGTPRIFPERHLLNNALGLLLISRNDVKFILFCLVRVLRQRLSVSDIGKDKTLGRVKRIIL